MREAAISAMNKVPVAAIEANRERMNRGRFSAGIRAVNHMRVATPAVALSHPPRDRLRTIAQKIRNAAHALRIRQLPLDSRDPTKVGNNAHEIDSGKPRLR